MQASGNPASPQSQVSRRKTSNAKQMSLAIEFGKIGQKSPYSATQKLFTPRKNTSRSIYSPNKTHSPSTTQSSQANSVQNVQEVPTTPRSTKRKVTLHSSKTSISKTRKSSVISQNSQVQNLTSSLTSQGTGQGSQSHELISSIPSLFNRKLSLNIIQKNSLPIEHATCVLSQYIWIASKNKIAIFDCATMRPVHQLIDRDVADSITCLHHFNKFVWAGHKSGKISIWNAETRSKLHDIPKMHTKRVNEMIQCGHAIFSVAMDHFIHVWDSVSLQYIGKLCSPPKEFEVEYFTSIILVPDTFTLWVSDNHGNLHVFSLQEGKFIHTIKTTFGKILRLRYTNHFIWSASIQGMVQVWNISTYHAEKFFHCHKKAIPCLEVTDSQVWSTSLDKTMHTYDAKELKVIKSLKSKNTELWMSGMTIADNSRVWTFGSDNQIRIWSTSGKVIRPTFKDIVFSGESMTIQLFYLHVKKIICTDEIACTPTSQSAEIEISSENMTNDVNNIPNSETASIGSENRDKESVLTSAGHSRKSSILSDLHSDYDSKNENQAKHSMLRNTTIRREKKKSEVKDKMKVTAKPSKIVKEQPKKKVKPSTSSKPTQKAECSVGKPEQLKVKESQEKTPIKEAILDKSSDLSNQTQSLSRDGDSESTTDVIDEITKSIPGIVLDSKDELPAKLNGASVMDFYSGEESDDSFELTDNYSVPSYENEIISLRKQLQNATTLTNHYKNRLDVRKQKLKEVKKIYWDLYAKYQRSQTEIFINNERALELEQKAVGTIEQEYQTRLLQLIPEEKRSQCHNIEDIIKNIEHLLNDKINESNDKMLSNGNHSISSKKEGTTPTNDIEAGQLEHLKKEISICYKEISRLIELIDLQQSEYNTVTAELEKKKIEIHALTKISDAKLNTFIDNI